MSTVVSKTRSKRPSLKHKRIRIRNLSKNIPIEVLEERIEKMAELEKAMSLYEHCLEVG
jgi:hypothetical protein